MNWWTKIKQKITNKALTVGIVTGRFQPPHPGHKSVFETLKNLNVFDDVIISTSTKNYPYSFSFKKDVFTNLLDIQESKILECQTPFRMSSILEKYYNTDNLILVYAVGTKDYNLRFGKYITWNSYFQKYSDDIKLYTHNIHSYILEVQNYNFTGNVTCLHDSNATYIRNICTSENLSNDEKINILKSIYKKDYDYEKFFKNGI